jgi:hypothetical protein
MTEHDELEAFCYAMEKPGHFCMQKPEHDGDHKFSKLTVIMDKDTAEKLDLNETEFLKITEEN